MVSFMKIVVIVQLFLFISHIFGQLVSNDIVEELKRNISNLQKREFDNSVLIQGLTLVLDNQNLLTQNLQRQLNKLDQGEVNITNSLNLQKASLVKVTGQQQQNAIQIGNLTSREGMTESEMNKLKLQFLSSISDIDLLTLSLDNVTGDVKNYGYEISNIEDGNKRQWVEFQELKSRIVSMFAKEEVEVAFLARYMNSSSRHDPSARVLPFDNILLNIGYGYNSTFGVFTARVRGIYLLQLTVAAAGEKVQMNLVVDNIVYGAVIADTTHVQSSTHAVVHLDIGSKVWIQKVVGERVGSRGLTQFSGVLIQAD